PRAPRDLHSFPTRRSSDLVCWDADFRSVSGKWAFHRFTGTKWQNVNDDNRKVYLTNAYRVLLTRARQGLVIFIPEGDADDATRPDRKSTRLNSSHVAISYA